MTFFANSGVAWPNVEQETREAGAASLDAASEMWKILSALEDRERRPLKREDLVSCAESFQRASDLYSTIADELKYEEVGSMTPAEIDLAAVHIPSEYRYYEGSFYHSNSRFYEMFLSRSPILVGDLYHELSQRTAHLAATIRAFELERENEDLAPQAFQMMKQWEILATLGRTVAVINRRRSSRS